MSAFRLKKWLPGIIFLAAQFLNTIYELTLDTRTLSWAPHTTQVYYHIAAFRNGAPVSKNDIQSRYGIAESYWEAHSEGNITRIIRAAERTRNDHPDSVLVSYSRNNGPTRLYRWVPE